MAHRPTLAEPGLNTGKKTRLHRILHEHGLRNGTAFFLPYDQGLEHGPRDFFANPAASDPKYIIKLALEGGFNGIALKIGLPEKFYWETSRTTCSSAPPATSSSSRTSRSS